MKNILQISIVIILFSILSSSCDQIGKQDSPTDIVNACLEAYKNKDKGKAGIYIKSASVQQNMAYFWLPEVADKKYSLKNEKVGPAQATVEIHSNLKDVPKLLVTLEKVGNSWLIVSSGQIH